MITNPDRGAWPGLTKRWLVDYYAAVAPVIVPHLAARPLTLARFPHGVGGRGFLQNECRGAPDFVRTMMLPLQGGRRTSRSSARCARVNDVTTPT